MLSFSLSRTIAQSSCSSTRHHECSYTCNSLPRGPNAGSFQSLDIEQVLEWSADDEVQVWDSWRWRWLAEWRCGELDRMYSRRVPYLPKNSDTPNPEVWFSVRRRPEFVWGATIQLLTDGARVPWLGPFDATHRVTTSARPHCNDTAHFSITTHPA